MDGEMEDLVILERLVLHPEFSRGFAKQHGGCRTAQSCTDRSRLVVRRRERRQLREVEIIDSARDRTDREASTAGPRHHQRSLMH